MTTTLHKIITSLTTLTLAAAPALTAAGAGAPAGLPGGGIGDGPLAGNPPGTVSFGDTWVLSADGCESGVGCYGGYVSDARMDTEVFEVGPNAVFMRTRVHGGIATSPLGIGGGVGETIYGLAEVGTILAAYDFRSSGWDLTWWVLDADGNVVEGPLATGMIANGTFTCEDLGGMVGNGVSMAFDAGALAIAGYTVIQVGPAALANPVLAGLTATAMGGIALGLHWVGGSAGDFSDDVTRELCEWAEAEAMELENIQWSDDVLIEIEYDASMSACLVCSEWGEEWHAAGDNGTMTIDGYVVHEEREVVCNEWSLEHGIDDNLDGFCD